MKKEKKNKQIYGDDDQVKYDLLMSKEDEVNKLVDTLTDKTLKKRATTFKKQKKLKDTSMNTGKTNKNKPIEDMDKEVFDMASTEPPVETVVKEEKTITKSKPKKEKKAKKGGKIVLWLFVIIFIITGGFIGYRYLDQAGYFGGNGANDTPIETVIPSETPLSSEVSGLPEDDTYSVNPKVEPMDLMKEYTIEDTLTLADHFNSTVVDYYNEVIDLVNKDFNPETLNDQIKGYIDAVQADLITLLDYMDVYKNVEGDYYMNSAIRRYENLIQMLSTLLGINDESDFKTTMNSFIQQENYLSQDSKTALIDFMSNNGIEFEDNGTYVTFDLLEAELPVETQAPTESEMPVESETPVSTEEPIVSEDPAIAETPTETQVAAVED